MLRIFATKWVHRWARKNRIHLEDLRRGVDEIRCGLEDANLGGYVIKKRIASSERGKRRRFRMLLAFKNECHTFYMYGFDKGKRANISKAELEALRRLARELLRYDDSQIATAIEMQELIEI